MYFIYENTKFSIDDIDKLFQNFSKQRKGKLLFFYRVLTLLFINIR